MPNDPIAKSIPGLLAAGAIALSGVQGGAAPKAPVATTVGHSTKAWTPEGMDPEMAPIAHLESSWGQNLKHSPHPKGVFHTAFGAMGLKPVTAHEQYLRSPTIQKLYPNLEKPEAFLQHFQEDPKLYNLTASAHWQWLRKRLGSPSRSAYGWRWGEGAAKRAPDHLIEADPYVEKFAQLSANKLAKMAIDDITRGEQKSRFKWDYSHLLTPENKMQGYQLHVTFHPADDAKVAGYPGKSNKDRFRAEISHHGRSVGQVTGFLHHNCLGGPCIEPHSAIQDGHTKRGLGSAAYEAMFKEAKLSGVKTVHGHLHSEDAAGLHRALSRKHGMGYKSHVEAPRSDLPYGDYEYAIKSELSKADGDASNVRRLLASDNEDDWTMAFKSPAATKDDMDHLLDRLAQKDPESYSPEHHLYKRRDLLRKLMDAQVWRPDHTFRAMSMPMFQGPGFLAAHFGRPNAPTSDSERAQIFDRVLDDIDLWCPKDGSIRPDLNTLYNHIGIATASQFDKVLGLVHKEKLPDRGFAGGFLRDHKRVIEPEFLSRWMDIAGDLDDLSLATHVAKRSNTSDAVFEKVMKLPEKLRTPSLRAYAQTGNMLPEHAKHLLAHPDSLTPDPAGRGGVKQAISDYFSKSKVPPDLAAIAIRHPHPAHIAQAALSRNESLDSESMRLLAKHDPKLIANFVGKTACPDDIRIPFVKKALDEGRPEDVSDLRFGYTLDADHVRQQFSPELTDVIINHPNPDLVKGIAKSPTLNTEQALKLVNRGLGDIVVNGISDREVGDAKDPNPDLDKKAIIDAIADRPEDHAARGRMASFRLWRENLTPKFYDSVAKNELIHDPFVVRELLNPGSKTVTPAFLHAALQNPGVRDAALYHPQLDQKSFDEYLPVELANPINPNVRGIPEFLKNAKSNIMSKHIGDRHLMHVKSLLGFKEINELADLYASPRWSQGALAKVWKDDHLFNSPKFMSGDRQRIRDAFLRNKNAPEESVKEFLTAPYEPGMYAFEEEDNPVRLDQERKALLNNLPVPLTRRTLKDVRQKFAESGVQGELGDIADEMLKVYEPDSVYRSSPYDDTYPANPWDQKAVQDVGDLQGKVDVRPGHQKLRKIRDMIMEKAPEKGELHPKDLPAGDWSGGRTAAGNISAKKINEHIASQEPLTYNYSHGYWSAGQRHNASSEPQKVFQVNLTNDMFDQLENAGVADTFRKLVAHSQTSNHPVRMNHTLGWVRYDGGRGKGFHIDEIQSDFGQSFVKQQAQLAREQGENPDEAAAAAEQMVPEAHQAAIKKILFKDRHPNEMLAEAFHQYLRDQGHDKEPVHMLHAETKGPLAQQNPNRPLPGHMQFTYDQLPERKLGMDRKQYGDIAPQDNTQLKGKPTWGGQVRKFEQDLSEWAEKLGIEQLSKSIESGDFKGMAKAIDPLGPVTVDHKAHLNAHPSGMTEEVNDYRSNVLESPTRHRRIASRDMGGITRKVVYKTRDLEGKERKYMVKPYHEKITRTVRDWMHHPIQGAAEMMHQALYHAAGIGDLHQAVHVSEHPMNNKQEPALVVHFAEGFKPVDGMKFSSGPIDDDLKNDVRKIGLLDFCSNNVDRHLLNLLVNPETQKPLAIDHSRSFQYKAPRKPYFKWDAAEGEERIVKPAGQDDMLFNYIGRNAIARVIHAPPPGHGGDDSYHYSYLKGWEDTIQKWWPSVSASVRAELDRQVSCIKNPKIVDHIRRNFHARADMLDQMAHIGLANYGLRDWHQTPVEMIPFED